MNFPSRIRQRRGFNRAILTVEPWSWRQRDGETGNGWRYLLECGHRVVRLTRTSGSARCQYCLQDNTPAPIELHIGKSVIAITKETIPIVIDILEAAV